MGGESSGQDGVQAARRRIGEPVHELDSRALLSGRREVIIQHQDERYRLRLTSNNKLILTK